MRIDHVAMYVKDIELTRSFYNQYFDAVAGERYHNPVRGFVSYFLSFDHDARLEIMEMVGVSTAVAVGGYPSVGLHHLAIGVGSVDMVERITERLRSDGYRVVGEPRTTGDGYYESVILDPDGNTIEITV